MSPEKLLPPLGSAIAAAGDRKGLPSLDVFVHTKSAPTLEQYDYLASRGVNVPTSPRRGATIFTGKLSPGAIEELSDQSWISHVKLADELRPMGHDLSTNE